MRCVDLVCRRGQRQTAHEGIAKLRHAPDIANLCPQKLAVSCRYCGVRSSLFVVGKTKGWGYVENALFLRPFGGVPEKMHLCLSIAQPNNSFQLCILETKCPKCSDTIKKVAKCA